MQLYDYYSCVGEGSFFHLSLKEYRMLLNDLGVIDEENPSCTRSKCLSHYKVRSSNNGAFVPLFLLCVAFVVACVMVLSDIGMECALLHRTS